MKYFREEEKRNAAQSNCIACHFPLEEFIACTNILQVLRDRETTINNQINTLQLQQNISVFYMKYLRSQLTDDDLQDIVISLKATAVLRKYHEICDKCKELYNFESINEAHLDFM